MTTKGLVGIFISLSFLFYCGIFAYPLDEEERPWMDALLGYGLGGREGREADQYENWTGRWMPERPGEPTPPPKVPARESEILLSTEFPMRHGVPMGRPSPDCDDAKTNLTVDWDGSPVNHTCYDTRIVPDRDVVPIQYCEIIPRNYVAMHKCMHEVIGYDTELPLYGTHRPLWPVYGEYRFVPKQRWLHSMEHGAVVLLYHPCANPTELKKLKTLVTGCLRRHIISAYNLLPEDRPFALVTWGCRLTMSYVDKELVLSFIREHSLRGPEQIARDGDYDLGLISKAKVVSDLRDSILCPQ